LAVIDDLDMGVLVSVFDVSVGQNQNVFLLVSGDPKLALQIV